MESIDILKSENTQIKNFSELALTEMKARRFKEAINFYNNILGLDPNHAYAWFHKGIAVFESSTLGNCRFKESKTYFEKAITLSDNKETRKVISEKIVELAKKYFPAYENFFKDHFKAPSSVDSLFSTYTEFDHMIHWATIISPKNTSAYETGWNLARQIIEMPKKYVNDKKWSAFGEEMAGKLTGNYGNEVSAKIDREIATQVKNKLESYSVKVKSNAKKYEKGIKGVSELKKLIEHYDLLVVAKPKVSSEGKSFDVWVKDEKSNNKIMAIVGVAFEGIFIYNLSDNNGDITFWSVVWFLIGLALVLSPFYNKPTEEKYTKQQGELSDWIKKTHTYIQKNNIDSDYLKKLDTASKNIYLSYYYFNSEKSETPTTMIKEINKHFFQKSSAFKLEKEIAE
tara:strand:+ start:1023 stop:2219 length:1197 start_codon:yes stop_codon:yes gene_type:complete